MPNPWMILGAIAVAVSAYFYGHHAGYVQNWLKVLKDDSKAIFTAASQASKAADLLRSFSENAADDDGESESLAA